MIIDFRVRPPYKSFAQLDVFYDRRTITDPVVKLPHDTFSEDCKSRDNLDFDQFLVEMDAAGIDTAVVMGRAAAPAGDSRAPHLLSGQVPNEEVAELVQAYPGRFIGFGGISGTDPKQALRELERCADYGFKGIAMDNPLSEPALFDDDRRLYNIYARAQELGLIVSLTCSAMIGPDMSYSEPVHIQRVALDFPELTIVVPHGAWPWVTQMFAVAMQCSNVYLIPDVYMNNPNMPGSSEFVKAANVGLDHRILFGTTYPILPLKQSVESFGELPFNDPAIKDRILGDNAARLLGL